MPHAIPTLDEIRACVREEVARPQPASSMDLLSALAGGDVRPWKAYKAKEVAVMMGISQNEVYNIPESELPRSRVGPNRGALRYLGINVMLYMLGQPPIPAEELREQALRQFTPPAPARPLRKGSSTRLL